MCGTLLWIAWAGGGAETAPERPDECQAPPKTPDRPNPWPREMHSGGTAGPRAAPQKRWGAKDQSLEYMTAVVRRLIRESRCRCVCAVRCARLHEDTTKYACGLLAVCLWTTNGPTRFAQLYISFVPTMVPLVLGGGGGSSSGAQPF